MLLEKMPPEEAKNKQPVSFAKKSYWVVTSKVRRFTIWLLNPSRLLKWLLCLLFLAFVALLALHKKYLDGTPFFDVTTVEKELSLVDWVATTTIYFAVSGWLVNSIVTIRNSVKQHTINTLLQSRLSKTYMDEANKARKALQPYVTKKIPAPATDIEAHADKDAIDYILNYIEFIAVGIRHGDLHEGVMKDSLRGIVTGFTGVCLPYISEQRVARPRTLENLMWLRSRWK